MMRRRRSFTSRSSTALAELLGMAPIEFPGDHGGFLGQPEEFAESLLKVLRKDGPVSRRTATS